MQQNKYILKTVLIITLSLVSLNAQVFVNQSGYLNLSPKYFYCANNPDSFYIIEKTTGEIRYRGAANLFILNDAGTGLTLYRGSFTDFQQSGEYFITTSLNDTSFNFSISSNVFEDVYKKSLKGFYYQRCGTALLQANAGVYVHSLCHNSDGTYHSTTGLTGVHSSTGGWHDAGDYGKYIVNAGITVGTLLMAYETYPLLFNQDDLNIPESNNGVPDILDEIKYELQWFFKMQHTNGGVFFKVTKTNFESFVMPNNDSGTRYIYQISSTATADFAAVMARAARIFAPFDSLFSNQCLTAALSAWNYLAANTSIVPAGGFTNPAGTYTGEYGDADDRDERLWASAELFETTGESTYKTYFESHYNQQGLFTSTMGWANVRDMALLTYLESKQSNLNTTIKTQIKNSLVGYCNTLLTRSNNNGFGISINPGSYYWGSNSEVLNNAVLLIFGYRQNGIVNFEDAALAQLNYILGINAHNLSFITGVGTKSVMHPHHRPSAADGIVNPVPGLLAGGPNQYLNDPLLQSLFNSSTPPALCYVDHQDSYASNEIAINWNAPLVFVAGYFNGKEFSSLESQGNLLPDGFELKQNFPNPFYTKNGYASGVNSTKIKFKIPLSDNVELKVYDILGREISTIISEYKFSGEYEVEFNSEDLPSGIYIYQIKSGAFAEAKKMMLLR